MPMVKRLKIIHPRLNLAWDHDAADWTSNADDATEWPLIEEDEAYTLADEVGGMVEQYTRYSTLADVYVGNMGGCGMSDIVKRMNDFSIRYAHEDERQATIRRNETVKDAVDRIAALEAMVEALQKLSDAFEREMIKVSEERNKLWNDTLRLEAENADLRSGSYLASVVEERDALRKERDEMDGWIKTATTTISDAIGGGSEMFIRRGDAYRIDPRFLANYIKARRQDLHEARVALAKARKEAKP